MAFGDDSTDMTRGPMMGQGQRPAGQRPGLMRPNRPFMHGRMGATGGIPSNSAPPVTPPPSNAPAPVPVSNPAPEPYNPYAGMKFNGTTMVGGGPSSVISTQGINSSPMIGNPNPMGIINSSPTEGIPATGGLPLDDPNMPPPQMGNPTPFDSPNVMFPQMGLPRKLSQG